MAKEYKDLVVGLDIGTAKVMAVVAEVMPGGDLRLAGLGMAPSHGLKRGVVVNIDATVQSIQQALKEAELMADCKIARVWTGITGSHIRGQNSTGMVIVRDKEVDVPQAVVSVLNDAVESVPVTIGEGEMKRTEFQQAQRISYKVVGYIYPETGDLEKL